MKTNKENTNLYKIENCIWSDLNGENFKCNLRNLDESNPQKAVEICINCLLFKDTNIELEDLTGSHF